MGLTSWPYRIVAFELNQPTEIWLNFIKAVKNQCGEKPSINQMVTRRSLLLAALGAQFIFPYVEFDSLENRTQFVLKYS